MGEEKKEHLLLATFQEYCDGGEFHQHVQELSISGQLTVKWVCVVARDIVDAISAMANENVLHRDLKKENILFNDGKANIADFGLSRDVIGPGGKGTIGVGTRTHMPRMADKGQYDSRHDLFSLGVTFKTNRPIMHVLRQAEHDGNSSAHDLVMLIDRMAEDGNLPFVNDCLEELRRICQNVA